MKQTRKAHISLETEKVFSLLKLIKITISITIELFKLVLEFQLLIFIFLCLSKDTGERIILFQNLQLLDSLVFQPAVEKGAISITLNLTNLMPTSSILNNFMNALRQQHKRLQLIILAPKCIISARAVGYLNT